MRRVLICCLVTLLDIQYIFGITIEGLSGTKTAGGLEVLTITCRATTSDAARHNSLVLSRNLSLSYQNLVTVANDRGNDVIQWANDAGGFEARTGATATGTMTGSSSTLTVEVPDFDCSDAGIYRCSLNGHHSDFIPVQPTPTATATLTVTGRNGNLSLAVEEYRLPGSSYPVTDDNSRYYKVGTIVTMTCEGVIRKTSQSSNLIDWYRLRPGPSTWERFYPPSADDVTTRIIGGSSNSCLQRVECRLKYNISSIIDNGGTSFRCQTSPALGGVSESNRVRLFSDNGRRTGGVGDANILRFAMVPTTSLILLSTFFGKFYN